MLTHYPTTCEHTHFFCWPACNLHPCSHQAPQWKDAKPLTKRTFSEDLSHPARRVPHHRAPDLGHRSSAIARQRAIYLHPCAAGEHLGSTPRPRPLHTPCSTQICDLTRTSVIAKGEDANVSAYGDVGCCAYCVCPGTALCKYIHVHGVQYAHGCRV